MADITEFKDKGFKIINDIDSVLSGEHKNKKSVWLAEIDKIVSKILKSNYAQSPSMEEIVSATKKAATSVKQVINLIPSDNIIKKIKVTRVNKKFSIHKVFQNTGLSDYLKLKVGSKEKTLESFNDPLFEEKIGKYVWDDAVRSIIQYSYLWPREIIRTPFMLITPFKWNKLLSLERFSLPLNDNDPVKYANFAYQISLLNNEGNKNDFLETKGTLVTLKKEQAAQFKIKLSLVRKSKINQTIDKIKQKISEINYAEVALGAQYGAVGKRAGKVIDKRFKTKASKMIRGKYYTEEEIFVGEKVIKGTDSVRIIAKRRKSVVNIVMIFRVR